MWDRDHKHLERVTWEMILADYVDHRNLYACPCDTAATPVRATGTQLPSGYPHSYEYVCGQEPAETGTRGQRAASSAKQGSNPKDATHAGVLLVCRHHQADSQPAVTESSSPMTMDR